MGVAQKWLTMLTAVGAGYMILTHPAGFYRVAQGTKTLVGGTIAQVSTGGKSG